VSERDKTDSNVINWVLLGRLRALSRAQKSVLPCSMLLDPSPRCDRLAAS